MHPLLRYRNLLFVIIGLITVFMAVGVTRLQISFSFESFYPKDDQEYAYYEHFQELFSEDQNFVNYVAIAQKDTSDVFDANFLAKVDSIFGELASIPGMDSSATATNFPELTRRGTRIRTRPFLRYDSPEAIAESKIRATRDTSFQGAFITRDQEFLCGYFFIEKEIFDTKQRDDLAVEMDNILESSGLPYVISGIPYIRTKYVQKIGAELLLFLSLAVILIATTLFITYRNAWGVIVPQVAILLALLWMLGFMGWTGQSINLINNLLIPILFVVGMSDIIHLTTKYLTELREGKDRETAMTITLKQIGVSIFLTSLTTGIGFASLLVSRIPPIREFGLYAAIGVIFTYAISVIILPGSITKIPPKVFLKVRSIENLSFWETGLLRVDRLTKERPGMLMIIWGILLAACSLLLFKIPVDTHLIEDIGKKDPVRKSMEFFESRSYGLRPFELGFEVKDSTKRIDDLDMLQELSKIQNYLSKDERLSPMLSMVTFLREGNALYRGEKKVPETQQQVDELIGFAYQQGQGELVSKLISPDGREGRISARMPDIGNVAYETLTANLDEFVAANCDTTLFTYRSTGHAYLTEQNLKYVRSSLLNGLGIAFVVIGFVMGFLFKSWRMLLISLVPNVIPLIFTGGVMGIFGITLTASTALVFVIAFGIAVDDTIHFLNRYRMERQRGLSVDEAVTMTVLGTGKAMLITSLVLMGGFILLLASDFGGTLNTGLFTALTIVFALLADLLLLPVLVRWIEKD